MATNYAKTRTEGQGQITEAEAIELGKKTQSEVVVYGSFILIDNKLQIQAKAIDVMSGRVSVSDSVQTPVNAKLFDNINLLMLLLMGMSIWYYLVGFLGRFMGVGLL